MAPGLSRVRQREGRNQELGGAVGDFCLQTGFALGQGRPPGKAAGQRQRRETGDDRPAIALHESTRVIGPAPALGQHRSCVEETLQILGQLADRAVALLGLAAECLLHDGVDVGRDPERAYRWARARPG